MDNKLTSTLTSVYYGIGITALSYLFLTNALPKLTITYNKAMRAFAKSGRNVFTIINKGGDFINKNTLEKFHEFYNKIDPSDQIVIILHTPGGSLTSSEAIFKCLNRHKGKITAYIPQYCYSGGMLIALACDEIIMSPNALVGPCDAQFMDKIGFGMTSSDVIDKVITEKRGLGQKIEEAWLAQGYEAQKVKLAQKNVLKEMLEMNNEKTRFNADTIEKIYDELFSGKYPHSYNLTPENLLALGINVKIEKQPRFVNDILYYDARCLDYYY